jgi:hypothetical protein
MKENLIFIGHFITNGAKLNLQNQVHVLQQDVNHYNISYQHFPRKKSNFPSLIDS